MNVLLTNRNLWILFFGQFVAISAVTQIVTLGGIVGDDLAPSKALATLPQSFHIIGVAVFAIPAALIMRRIGRPAGFSMAATMGIVSQLLAVFAIHNRSFILFVLAAVLLGFSTSFALQLRFSAIEHVSTRFTARAISFVLSGAILGAFSGPFLASRGAGWIPAIPYAGGFLTQACMFLAVIILYMRLPRLTDATATDNSVVNRPLIQIITQPVFVVAVLAGATAYTVMSLIMTATPLSMHIHDGFSLDRTADVIRAHVLGMYVPALFTGALVDRLGNGRIMIAGMILMAVCIGIALAGQAYTHYWWALVLLGISWNFLYVCGTALLTQTYTPGERFSVQAFNDFTIFALTALGALMAGVLIHNYGWTIMILTCVPMLVMLMAVFAVVRLRGTLDHQLTEL